MTAIQDAEKAMYELGEKHQDKMMNLFSGKMGDFWKKEESQQMVKSLSIKQGELRWSAYVFDNSYPVRAERFETQKEARAFKTNKLGVVLSKEGKWGIQASCQTRNERGMKVTRTCKVMRSDSPEAKELDARLPKVRTKVREPKKQQLDIFSR